MSNLYTMVAKKVVETPSLTSEELSSIVYHDIFDYALNFSELIKWRVGGELKVGGKEYSIATKNGYFFLEGRDGLVYKRLLKRRIAEKKLQIAKRASALLRFIPSIKMIAVTGSLAMQNASDEGDIDLMIITKRNSLWTTRAITYLLTGIFGIKSRRAGGGDEKDRLCLNMWFDEGHLVWSKGDRNIYTAHEICQIMPLVNKDRSYEKFLSKNKWILKFWPNAVRIGNWKLKIGNSPSGKSIFEWAAYKLQRLYMRNKITREVVTSTRAIFHPYDWGRVVLSRLGV